MKICIFGAGAIGGFVGAKLAEVGAEVSMVARGPHLSEMKRNGLTLLEEGLDSRRIKKLPKILRNLVLRILFLSL